MNQLGGWWRLWIVAAVLWWALVLAAVVFGGPVSSEVGDDLLTGAQVANLQASREAIKARVAGQCLPASTAMEGVEKTGNPFDAYNTWRDDPLEVGEQPGVTPTPAGFHLDQPRLSAKPVRYMRVITSCITWGWLGIALLFALGPPVALLAAVVAGRWIWRGFRSPASQAEPLA